MRYQTLFQISVVLTALVPILTSCSEQLNQGNIYSAELSSGRRIRYVAFQPTSTTAMELHDILLVIPTGEEDLSAAVHDANNIWPDSAVEGGLLIVIPSSSTGGLFRRPEFPSFGLGAWEYFPYILEDIEDRYSTSGSAFSICDIGGNGVGLVNAMLASRGVIQRGYLVPSFSFDENAIRKAIENELRVLIIIGNRELNERENEVADLKESLVQVKRVDLDAIVQVDDEKVLHLMQKYAALIRAQVSTGAWHDE